MVGSLSALNAVAGANSDDLPLLVVVGGPNSNDEARRHVVHHTIGTRDLHHGAKCYSPVVGKILRVHHVADASAMIDEALHLCGMLRKPVYLEIACDLTTQEVPLPVPVSRSFFSPRMCTDEAALQSVIAAIHARVASAAKVVMVAGSKLRTAAAVEDFDALAAALECAVAIMPDAKGLFDEHHPQYVGCYWGCVSSPHVQAVVESADLILLCGVVLSDYSTVGWTAELPPQKTIHVNTDHCDIGDQHYPHICMKHVLAGLVAHAPSKPESLHTFRSNAPVPGAPVMEDAASPLSLAFLQQQLQSLVDRHVSSVVVETGDAWFIGQQLRLPGGVKYHAQMLYGSCGWALGACLGVGMAFKNDTTTRNETPRKRVLALIGDGSFQFSAQGLSTLIRQDVDVTIILLNNRTYTIEEQIHGGPYNQIPNWKYAELVDVFRDGNTNAAGVCATMNAQLQQALDQSRDHSGVLLVECCLSPDDCTSHLKEWGSRVAAANMAR
jgi:pyruvate decarboxylase